MHGRSLTKQLTILLFPTVILAGDVLTFVEVQRTGLGGVEGLDGASSVTVSPDGKHVYATANIDDAVALFSRNLTDGKLTFVEVYKDGQDDGSGNTIDGLNGANWVTVSPDGKHVYVTGYDDWAVAVFSRNTTTGALTYVEVHKDGVAGVDGLYRVNSVTVSPDGKHVYTTGYYDDALTVFSRNSVDGKLTIVDVYWDGQDDGSGNTIDGLFGPRSVIVTPDGKYVYTASWEDAVPVFSRDTTDGKLTFVDVYWDGQDDGSGNIIDGLDGAYAVTLSPDEKNIYVIGYMDDYGAVAVFSRNTADGRLIFIEVHKNYVSGVEGIWRPVSVIVSPDGKYVYVTGIFDSAIVVFSRDTNDGKLSFVEVNRDGQDDGSGNTIDGLSYVASVTVSPDTEYVYAAGGLDDALAVFSVDITAPTVTISSTTSSPTNTSPIPVTATFSESVTGFDASDVTVENGTLSNFSVSSNTYTFDITPSGDGTVTVDIAANVAQDGVGYGNTASSQFSITYDATAPTVTVSSTITSPTNSSPVPMTVTFSESVAGFDASGVTLGNSTLSNFSGSGTTYTFDLTPSGEGTVTVDIGANATQDAAGNGNTVATQFSIAYDTTSPTVTVSSTLSSPTTTSPIAITVTFSESVTGFDASDVTLGNGTLSNFSGSGTTYTFDLTPSGEGTVTVDIAANAAQDAAGNGNTVAMQFSITYDTGAPTVSITSSSDSSTNTSPIPITVTFSESVTGFDASDLTLDNGTLSNFSGSGTTYTFDLTPSGEGTVTVDIGVNATQDAAGNGNTVATQFSIAYDTTSPTVTVSSTLSSPTTTSPIAITVTFSESVTGFDASDVTLGNGTLSNFSGSGTTYTFDVTPSDDGTVTVDIAANTAQDAAGNGNTVATQFSITYDITAPTVTVSSTLVSPTNTSPIPIAITFNESVTGFEASHVTLGNGTLSNFSGSGTTYTFDLTPSGEGTVTVDIGANVAQDAAGNDNTVAIQFSIIYDDTDPTVTVSSTLSSPTNILPIPISVTFSKSVTGFDSSDVIVENGSITSMSFSGTDTTYTFTVTPDEDGEITVDIEEHVVQDEAGNNNTAAVQFSIIYDGTAPIVGTVIDGITEDHDWTGDDSTFTATWSGFIDSLSGIEQYEYAIGTTPGGTETLDWVSAESDTTTTAIGLSLTSGETYYVSVRATDMAGNTSSMASSDGITVDTDPPITGIVSDGTGDDIDWTNSPTSLSANWTNFSDDLTGIASYEYAIGTELGGIDLVGWTSVGLDTSFIRVDLSLTSGITYYISVRATDEVDNTSAGVSSDGITVDYTLPTVVTPWEGSESDDLDWQQSTTTLDIYWSGSDDDGEIDFYEYSVGTAPGGSDIVAWRDNDTDTSVTIENLSLTEGVIYYSNVKAYDKASNVSEVTNSDGIQVDITAPTGGSVNDGLSGDITYLDSPDSVSSNWSGFEDAQSGISHYEVAIGSTPGGTDITDFVDAGSGNTFTVTGLTLEHGSIYYCSVRAVDLVYNVSEIVSSDGFTIDLYPGPPYVVQTMPDSGSYLPPIRSSEIAIKFSEPVSYYELDLQSVLDFDIQFGASQSSDSIVIMLESPLISLDTIQISLSNVTDFGGLVADETIYTYYTDLLGDYTSDLKIDVNDLSIFVEGWTNKDYTLELGPVTGDVPHLIPDVDGVYNIWDVASFTRMWHWSHQTISQLMLAREPMGEPLKVVQGAGAVAVTLPEEASAGQFIFQYSTGSVDVSITAQEPSEERIFLSLKDAEIGQLLVEFGYLASEGSKVVKFDIESFTRNNATATLIYTVFSNDNEILSQGVRSIELIAIPEKFTLHQNYPNPFNPTTTILYDLPEESRVNLVIYDILGRQVRAFIKEERPAGYHSVIWNSKDDMGVNVGAGVYIYMIQTHNVAGGSHVRSHKMLLLK